VKIPWSLRAAIGSQLLPPLAASRHGRRLPAARRWVAAWALLLFAYDLTQFALAVRGRHNLWLRYPFGPIETGVVLIALSLWHADAVFRLALRLAVPLFTVVWGLLVAFVERTDTFGLVTGPLQSLVLLSAALFTLLARARVQEGPLAREDWFWVSAGLSLWYGAAAAQEPIARLLVAEHPSVVSSAYQVKAVVDVFASLIIARGMLCPILPPRSGGPSPPVSSRSLSS
jgi:hypothetical protein